MDRSMSEQSMDVSSIIDVELRAQILECINRALDEDIFTGDVTTDSIVPVDAILLGNIVAKQAGVVAGLKVSRMVFQQLNADISVTANVSDGSFVEAGMILARVSGSARALLTGERTALNLLGRMSGIATLTRQFVEAVAGTKAVILDTRKTAPGLRAVDKLAVRLGGGQNHRTGLFDMVLIKDNHIDFAGSITAAVERVRATGTKLEIEVEARSLDDLREALSLDVERVLLDNMTTEKMREAVTLTAGRAKLEASGNITLQNVRAVAETGVDFISVGMLTHSAPVFDVSLKWAEN
jgi:nicotinate-nucleotide pyrophosphorylase (carboxylating)